MRCLLIEDNEKLANAVVEHLQLDGHAVDHAPTLDQAQGFTAVTDYDLILLDIMLPDGDGRDFLNAQRQAEKPTPVIVITARAAVSERIGLLDLGADDYLTKPFDFAELNARCRAVLRRHSGVAANLLRVFETELDPTSAELRFGGKSVALRNRELRLLEVMFGAPGQVFSKSHLMDRLYSLNEDASENAIEVYIGRLRKRLDGSGARIETVRGLGYRLMAA
jgi:two-component system response regulator TctD